jgi:hypothetical protein
LINDIQEALLNPQYAEVTETQMKSELHSPCIFWLSTSCTPVQAIHEALAVQHGQLNSTDGSHALSSAAGEVQYTQLPSKRETEPPPTDQATMRLSEFDEREPSVISLRQGIEEAPVDQSTSGPGYSRRGQARGLATNSSLSFGGEAVPDQHGTAQSSDAGEDVSHRWNSTQHLKAFEARLWA